MKILVFTSQIHLLGGAEKLAVELVEGLNSQPGVRADLLVMGSEDVPGPSKTKRRLLDNGVQVQFLGRGPATGWRGMLRYVLKLRGILREGAYEFIETSMPGPTILACCATLGLRTRAVVGIHAVYRRDHQNRFSDRFLRLSTKYNRRVRFYAISKYAMEQWIEYARIKKERIRVVYNSVSADFFEPSASSLWPRDLPNVGADDYKVLFVGRLCQTKGLDTLIEAMGPILGEEKMQLFIVGGPNDTPESFFEDEVTLCERIETQIACSGWSERVHFFGLREDVLKIMGCVDLLVHPARKEGFGLVLVEALAMGLPIASTNVDGIPEVLSDTDSILVSPSDPAAMRDAVLEILRRTPEDAKRSCKRARLRAQCFMPERRVEDVMALFRDLSADQAAP